MVFVDPVPARIMQQLSDAGFEAYLVGGSLRDALLGHPAADWDVGTKLDIEGRVQSRKYIKLIDSVAYEKTAYEVSVTEAREVSADGEFYVNNVLYS